MEAKQLLKFAKQCQIELNRRSLPKSDKRRSSWRKAAINRGVFTMSRKDLKAVIASV